jgi:hypothetical protein
VVLTPGQTRAAVAAGGAVLVVLTALFGYAASEDPAAEGPHPTGARAGAAVGQRLAGGG